MTPKTYHIREFDFSTGRFKPDVTVVFFFDITSGRFTLKLVSSQVNVRRDEITKRPQTFRSLTGVKRGVYAGEVVVSVEQLERLGFVLKRKGAVAS